MRIKEAVLAAAEKDFSTFSDIVSEAAEEKFAEALGKLLGEKQMIGGVHITYLDGKEKKTTFIPHHEMKKFHPTSHHEAAKLYLRHMMPGSNVKRVVRVVSGSKVS